MLNKVIFRSFLVLFASIFLFSCAEKITDPVSDVSIPNSPVPADESTKIEINLSLSWKATDAVKYDVYFDKVNPPIAKIAQDTSVNSILVENLDYNTVYYWKVIATKSDGSKKEGPVWKFTTRSRFSGVPGYVLIPHFLESALPCFINIMFQVTDMDNRGVTNLTKENFILLENENPISPTESALNIRKRENIPYVLKTVLLIDNSSSVASTLNSIKDAASTLINNMTAKQELAIYVFSETPVLLQDFTDNKQLLLNAVSSIQQGFATTNLYGAIVTGLKRWEDNYSLSGIQQGALICLTDGSDTQGSSTLNDVLNERGDKKVYTIGLGSEIDENVLRQIGNSGYFKITNVSQVTTRFLEIQEDLNLYAGSFYWLNYMTPKRGNQNITIRLSIKDNVNISSNSYIFDEFNSQGFYSVAQGLFVNVNSSLPYGIDTIFVNQGDTVELSATTYLGQKPPNYIWGTSDRNIARIITGYESGATTKLIALGNIGSSTIVSVNDTSNLIVKNIRFVVSNNSIPADGLIAHYTFEGNTNDISGSNNNALGFNTEFSSSRKGTAGQALSLNATNAILQIPEVSSNIFSCSFWINISSANTNNSVILGNAYSDSGNIQLIWDNVTSKIGFSKGGVFNNAANSLVKGVWNHIVIIMNGSITRIYLNKKMILDTNSGFINSFCPLRFVGNSVTRDSGMFRII